MQLSPNRPLDLLQTAVRKLGVNRSVGYALIGRGWAALSGLVTLLLLTRFLTLPQQDYYYNFTSVLGFTLLLEMGLTYVILQVASHERAALEWVDGRLEGDGAAKARLASLLRISLLWYGTLALLLVGVLMPAGIAFFYRHRFPGPPVAWLLPWIGVVLASSGVLALSPILALIEGCGRVTDVTQVQMQQNIVASLLLWLCLFMGCGLFAAALFNGACLVFQAIWLWRRQGCFLRDLLAAGRRDIQIEWREEVWPFQWRIALSSIATCCVFLFIPLLTAAHRPNEAGRLGPCLAVMNAIVLIALSWVTTKSAPFGTLIARRQWQDLDRLFFPALWQSWSVVALGGSCFWLGVLWLRHIHSPLAARLLDPISLALLVGTALLSHIVTSIGLYLRAHKKDPLLGLSVTVGILIASLNALLARPYGVQGMMGGYFLVYLLVGLSGSLWLLRRCRRAWHVPPSPESAAG